MKSQTLLRIAAGCILFFAVGHSIGHLTRKNVTDPEGQHVLSLMEQYKFSIGVQFRSYDEFYTGMSLNLIITLLGFTLLLWIASNLASTAPKICRQLLTPILLAVALFTVTSFAFFFLVPAITCLVASGLTGYAMLRLRKGAISGSNTIDFIDVMQ